MYLVLECPGMIPGLELYLSLERIVLERVSAVPVSGKDCPGLIPGLALYLFLERIVLE
jgi:hypothetical protein